MGVYDGSGKEECQQVEGVMREHYRQPAKDICNVLMDYAVKRDERLRQIGEQDRIDDKTAFIISGAKKPVTIANLGAIRVQ